MLYLCALSGTERALKALRSATARAVAAVIAAAREEAGLTQRSLAARLKRPHSVIGMIESNQRQVNVPEFIAIAGAIGADPAELFKRVLRERLVKDLRVRFQFAHSLDDSGNSQ